MALGPQFEQPELALTNQSKPNKPESSFEYKKRQVASGVGTSRSAHDQRINTFADSPMESRTPTDSFHRRGDQLKMFMTPREIEKEWQPLDADRDETWGNDTYGTNDSRADNTTYRARRTDGQSNYDMRDERTVTGAVTDSNGDKARHSLYKRPGGRFPMEKSGTDGMESNEQLWDRKYDEATESTPAGYNSYGAAEGTRYRTPHGHETSAEGAMRQVTAPGAKTRDLASGAGWGWYRSTGPVPGGKLGGVTLNSRRRGSEQWVPNHEITGSSSPHSNMVDSIIGEGIKSPIRLGLNYGQEDKPQLAGGHHRMSVARVHTPDRLAPVLYHEDIREARSSNTTSSYKYT